MIRVRSAANFLGGMYVFQILKSPQTIFPSPPNSYAKESVLSMSLLSISAPSSSPLRAGQGES
jgi:hypothetical protein